MTPELKLAMENHRKALEELRDKVNQVSHDYQKSVNDLGVAVKDLTITLGNTT